MFPLGIACNAFSMGQFCTRNLENLKELKEVKNMEPNDVHRHNEKYPR